jgi:hypothetical protein
MRRRLNPEKARFVALIAKAARAQRDAALDGIRESEFVEPTPAHGERNPMEGLGLDPSVSAAAQAARLREAVSNLSKSERKELWALMRIGRGEGAAQTWQATLEEAERLGPDTIAETLVEDPDLHDHIMKGLFETDLAERTSAPARSRSKRSARQRTGGSEKPHRGLAGAGTAATIPIDIDAGQVARWAVAEQRRGEAPFRLSASVREESRGLTAPPGSRLGEDDREDLDEVAIMATLELAPLHASDGWRLIVTVEDEAGPRILARGESDVSDFEIAPATFLREFIEPERGVASVSAEVESREARARLEKLIEAIETNRHSKA